MNDIFSRKSEYYGHLLFAVPIAKQEDKLFRKLLRTIKGIWRNPVQNVLLLSEKLVAGTLFEKHSAIFLEISKQK